MTIFSCIPSRWIPAADLKTIGQMYPYGTLGYRDLCRETKVFLAEKFAQANDAQVIAISGHNGRGRQWGIILLQYANESDWHLVGQFGHGLRLPFTNWYLDWSYF
jgi:hypothetical protein